MHKSSFFQCKMPHNNNHGHITIRSNTLQWLTTDDKPFIQLDNILSQNSNYITSEYKYNQIPSPCSLRAGRATGILFLRKIYAIARTQRDIGSFRASSSISNRDPALSKPFRARVETPTMLLQRDFESRRPSIDRSIDRSPAYFPSNRPGLVNTPLVSAPWNFPLPFSLHKHHRCCVSSGDILDRKYFAYRVREEVWNNRIKFETRWSWRKNRSWKNYLGQIILRWKGFVRSVMSRIN